MAAIFSCFDGNIAVRCDINIMPLNDKTTLLCLRDSKITIASFEKDRAVSEQLECHFFRRRRQHLSTTKMEGIGRHGNHIYKFWGSCVSISWEFITA
jgi:hypothetical protein